MPFSIESGFLDGNLCLSGNFLRPQSSTQPVSTTAGFLRLSVQAPADFIYPSAPLTHHSPGFQSFSTLSSLAERFTVLDLR